MIEVEIDKEVYLTCYHHLLDENDIDIEILWGGRDSGKSKFVAQILTEESLSSDYFRCLLIKETHDSIKDSQWQMIQDTAAEWGVDNLYSFLTSPLSIKCVNGGAFATRGMNNPARIRSFTNPSHAWVEEANQLTETGFITLLTSLRSDFGPVKLYLTLNPESTEADYQDFFLYKWFFADNEPKLSFTGIKKIKIKVMGEERTIQLKYRATHVTYHDNPYVSDQRIAFHESLAEANPYWYRVFTEGLWGNKKNESPYLTTWSRAKHIAKSELFAKPSLFLYSSWDFNRNPQACTVIQHDEKAKKLSIIEVIKIHNTGTDKMCDILLLKYPKSRFVHVVNGDYSGNTPTSIYNEQVTNYSVIKAKLALSDGQIQIEPNPSLEDNRTLMNMLFAQYTIEVCPVKAKPFIFDAENTVFTAEGKILKENRKDPKQQADVLDTVRYHVNKYFKWMLRFNK